MAHIWCRCAVGRSAARTPNVPALGRREPRDARNHPYPRRTRIWPQETVRCPTRSSSRSTARSGFAPMGRAWCMRSGPAGMTRTWSRDPKHATPSCAPVATPAAASGSCWSRPTSVPDARDAPSRARPARPGGPPGAQARRPRVGRRRTHRHLRACGPGAPRRPPRAQRRAHSAARPEGRSSHAAAVVARSTRTAAPRGRCVRAHGWAHGAHAPAPCAARGARIPVDRGGGEHRGRPRCGDRLGCSAVISSCAQGHRPLDRGREGPARGECATAHPRSVDLAVGHALGTRVGARADDASRRVDRGRRGGVGPHHGARAHRAAGRCARRGDRAARGRLGANASARTPCAVAAAGIGPDLGAARSHRADRLHRGGHDRGTARRAHRPATPAPSGGARSAAASPPDPVAPVGAEVSASAGASPMAAPTAEL
jgi:hypothetical protein